MIAEPVTLVDQADILAVQVRNIQSAGAVHSRARGAVRARRRLTLVSRFRLGIVVAPTPGAAMQTFWAKTATTVATPPPGGVRDTAVDRRRMISELRPRDRIGWLYLGWATTCTATALWLSATHSVVAWIAGQLLLAAALNQWFVLLHESGHSTLFRTKALHKPVGHVAAFFAGIPFVSWKAVHALHHRWTGWQDLDPTTADLVPRQLPRGQRMLVDFCWRTWLPLFSILYRTNNYWNLPRLFGFFDDRRQRRRLVTNASAQLVAYGVVIVALGPMHLLKLVGLGTLIALVFQDVLILSQHTHIPQDRARGSHVKPIPAIDQEEYTRSLDFPPWFARWVLLNVNDHELHHMYPSVPAWDLPRLGHATRNRNGWLHFVVEAKRLRGEVFLFKNRDETGAPI